MVVWRRDARLVVDMGKDLKAEFGILVEHLEPARHLLPAIGFDEVAVAEELLELQTHLLAAVASAIALENGAAIRHELIEVVGHGCLPGHVVALASRIGPASARAIGVHERAANAVAPSPRGAGRG